jgi:hypothetical protein
LLQINTNKLNLIQVESLFFGYISLKKEYV